MSSKQISPLLRSWYKWKALRLPWRKKFLVGLDLQGNTYWEFRDERHGPADLARWRRIVEYPRSTHYGEVQVSPQWHQWLRHLRERPPTVPEQHAEQRRQVAMKALAAAADARWEAKPRVMEAPPSEAGETARIAAAAAAVARPEVGPEAQGREEGGTEGDERMEVGGDAPRAKAPVKDDPWKKQQRAGPSEDWQPQAWTPPASKR